jgi:hypothetical protein
MSADDDLVTKEAKMPSPLHRLNMFDYNMEKFPRIGDKFDAH